MPWSKPSTPRYPRVWSITNIFNRLSMCLRQWKRYLWRNLSIYRWTDIPWDHPILILIKRPCNCASQTQIGIHEHIFEVKVKLRAQVIAAHDLISVHHWNWDGLYLLLKDTEIRDIQISIVYLPHVYQPIQRKDDKWVNYASTAPAQIQIRAHRFVVNHTTHFIMGAQCQLIYE